ncbi:uncharacterized protein LOC120092499 isoform X3 [Benincasa hispida]|uniref:uncharacterized protein LOC120092499 isoform X1 n=1 Tax=Benincasa hispida TaxID=102211 RepID=UPI0018FF9F22|nr:uncharacterized protein LOC120092499 isoform X1 [Benincasa hispida]XP_038906533.1 uncharacterized protein LOC120092499 isoform X2 [Benincasa hispida]XP_038906540.1 uncharacterized protein LOC120092499 isoform X3 [Benincasa hispida]
MEPQIGRPLLYAATARDIWEAARDLYSKRQKASRLYTLHKQVHECKQGTMDVTFYFNKLFVYWQEMDLCRQIVWNCAQDGAQYLKLEEADQVYVFLAGLNLKFDNVRSCILGQRPTPSLREVCSEVRLEEDRSHATNNPVTVSTNASAFVTKASSSDSDKKPTPVCEHCKKPWYTKDQCWKLHGRPPNSRRRQSHDKSNFGRALVSDYTTSVLSR